MPKAIETIVSAKEKRRYSLRAQAEDLAEARKALESAANISRGLWFTFMSLAAGVFITTGTVTHRDLFLETPVKLPLLNAELPMVAFFWVAPLMFLLFHGYLMLNLTSLGDNVRHYFDLVDDTGLDPKSKNKLYLQLPNFMVVQMLRARREKYWTTMGYALHVVVALTVVVGPLVALLFLQVKFLPFHSHIVTWVQRAVIAVDAVAIFYFWPQIVGKPASLLVWYVRLLLYAIVAFVFLFSFFVAQFPGEKYYGNGPFERSGIAERLFRGDVNDVTGEPLSFFSDRLVLANEDFIDLDDDKLSKADKTVSLRGRNLVRAYLARADLRKADFTGAILIGANLRSASLQGAIFEKADLPASGEGDEDKLKTRLIDANFSGACLNDANFNRADMTHATFDDANLDGATLTNAELQGAKFFGTSFVGAKLIYAKMKGANFNGSDLSNAKLDNADLTGSTIYRTQMLGASLNAAELQAAIFFGNSVQGMSDAGAKWETTFVAELSERRIDVFIAKEPRCISIAAAKSDALEKPRDKSAALPSRKAIEITSKAVSVFPKSPTENDTVRWRNRKEALKIAICGASEPPKDPRNEASVESLAAVLHRLVDSPSFGKYPYLHLGPIKNLEFADEILDPVSCRRSAELPQSLKNALKCWRISGPAVEPGCTKKALSVPYFQTPLQ